MMFLLKDYKNGIKDKSLEQELNILIKWNKEKGLNPIFYCLRKDKIEAYYITSLYGPNLLKLLNFCPQRK